MGNILPPPGKPMGRILLEIDSNGTMKVTAEMLGLVGKVPMHPLVAAAYISQLNTTLINSALAEVGKHEKTTDRKIAEPARD